MIHFNTGILILICTWFVELVVAVSVLGLATPVAVVPVGLAFTDPLPIKSNETLIYIFISTLLLVIWNAGTLHFPQLHYAPK